MQFKKVVACAPELAVKHFATAKKMLTQLAQTGGTSSTYVGKEILVLAKKIGPMNKAIFLPLGYDLIIAMRDDASPTGSSEHYIYGVSSTSRKIKRLAGPITTDSLLEVAWPGTNYVLYNLGSSLRSEYTYDQRTIELSTSGAVDFTYVPDIYDEIMDGGVDVSWGTLPSYRWPLRYALPDRVGIYTPSGVTNTKVLTWPGQPTRPEIYDRPGLGAFVLDTASSFYVRTNSLGSQKQLGKTIVWGKQADGTYTQLNSGVQGPSNDFYDLASLVPINPDVAKAQMVPMHSHHIGQAGTLNATHSASTHHVTPHRVYLTYTDNFLYQDAAYLHVLGVCGVERTTPDSLLAGQLLWTNYVGGYYLAFGGYLADPSGRFSGIGDFVIGYETSPTMVQPVLGLRVYFGPEDGTNAIWDFTTTWTIPNLFALIGEPAHPSLANPIALTTAVECYPDPITMYVYGSKIIILLEASSSGPTESRAIPTGVFSIDIATGTAGVIYCGYKDQFTVGAQTHFWVASSIKASLSGDVVWLHEVSTAGTYRFTKVGVATGVVEVIDDPPPKVYLDFMQPLYNR